jgi:putative peptide zinc metalloprotease protein
MKSFSLKMKINTKQMKNHLLNYSYEALCISSKEYVLSYNNKYYKIEEPVYSILKNGQTAKTIEELFNLVNVKNTFSKSDLIDLIDKKLMPLFNSTVSVKKESVSSFWIKRQLLESNTVEKIATPFSFLYGNIFYPALFILLVINIYLAFNSSTNESSSIETATKFTILKWSISYLSLFVIIFLHEIGHAAAAIKSGIKPRSIGLGFYTVLPVMYTDLTEAWKLNKKNKIKVNLGGIYMQLIIGILLSIILFITTSVYVKEILTYLITINTTIIIINLFPLLKFDGYWILSDLVEIPNLIKESNAKLLSFITKKGPFDDEVETPLKRYQNVVLIIFSILRILFIIMMVFMVLMFVTFSIIKTYSFITLLPLMEFNTTTAIEILKKVLMLFIMYILSRKYFKMAKSYISKRK